MGPSGRCNYWQGRSTLKYGCSEAAGAAGEGSLTDKSSERRPRGSPVILWNPWHPLEVGTLAIPWNP